MSGVESPGTRKMPVHWGKWWGVGTDVSSRAAAPALGGQDAGTGLVQPGNSQVWGCVK